MHPGGETGDQSVDLLDAMRAGAAEEFQGELLVGGQAALAGAAGWDLDRLRGQLSCLVQQKPAADKAEEGLAGFRLRPAFALRVVETGGPRTVLLDAGGAELAARAVEAVGARTALDELERRGRMPGTSTFSEIGLFVIAAARLSARYRE